MWDFLTFNTLISDKILIIAYYFFAISFPLAILLFINQIKKRFPLLASIQNMKLTLLLVAIVLFMELFMRMAFELMIAYFDMHTYLQTIQKSFILP